MSETQRESRWVHFSNDPLPWNEAEAQRLLGGKGLSLCLLSRAGFAVPPAFTILTTACQFFHAHARQWPAGLGDELKMAVARLEVEQNRSFGSGPQPLTLAVRSGAAMSMPGQMATFLNCGLTESLVRELDQDAMWKAFADFLGQEQLLHLAGVDANLIRELLEENKIQQSNAKSYCEQVLAASRDSAASIGLNDPDSLLRLAIMGVWDSWESPGAQRFRVLSGDVTATGTAVTIQVMFQANVSGVAFSQNPTALSLNEIVVEVVPGLGQKLVGGHTTPARWNVDRNSKAVCATYIPDSPGDSPSDSNWLREFEEHQLSPLCDAVINIEALYRTPVDVDFGCARGELVFFQARPIAKTMTSDLRESVRQIERDRLLNLARQGRKLWVRHNLAETLPTPTPLTWDLWRQFMTGSGGYGKLYRRLGYQPAFTVARDGFLELIAGRIYADPQRLTEMICHRYPLTYDIEVLRTDPNAINRPPSQVDLNQLSPFFLLQWPIYAWTFVRLAWIQRRLARQAAADFDRVLVPRLNEYVEVEKQIDLASLDIDEVFRAFERRRQRMFDDFAPETLLPGTLGAAAWFALEQRLLPILGESECRSFFDEFSRKNGNPITMRQHKLQTQMARGDSTVHDFLQDFGHRGLNEMDLSAPRWRELPEIVSKMAEGVADLPGKGGADHHCESLENLLLEALKRNGARCLFRELAPLLEQAQRLVPYRELGKHELMKAYELIREAVIELGKRLGFETGIHYLTLTELGTIRSPRPVAEGIRGGLTSRDLVPDTGRLFSSTVHDNSTLNQLNEVVIKRRELHAACHQLEIPALLEVDGALHEFGLPPLPSNRGHNLSGQSLSSGQARGRVHLWDDGRPPVALAEDSVLVATTIDPGMIPLLAGIAALVVEQGGALSHVALLARQYSIPALVIPRITQHVHHGEAIRVDADRAWIEFPERPA